MPNLPGESRLDGAQRADSASIPPRISETIAVIVPRIASAASRAAWAAEAAAAAPALTGRPRGILSLRRGAALEGRDGLVEARELGSELGGHLTQAALGVGRRSGDGP